MMLHIQNNILCTYVRPKTVKLLAQKVRFDYYRQTETLNLEPAVLNTLLKHLDQGQEIGNLTIHYYFSLVLTTI